MDRRRFTLSLAACTAAPALRAQAWPSRAIRIVVPFPPGSAADAIPRGVARHLQSALGQPCVIENKPGAGGAIGAEWVAQAAPDGHTLLSHTSGITIQPHLRDVPYHPLRDFVPVSQTIAGSYVLVVPPSFPAGSLREFVDLVRRAPGRYSYGSHGSGSGPHLAMELLKREAGLYIVHVPFRGAAASMQELLAGRLDMAFDTTFAALPQLRTGRLKAIALGGPRGAAALPGVAGVQEMYPGFDTDGWQGFFAPAGTPEPVVQALSRGIADALADPELAQSIGKLGFQPVGSTPAKFAAVVRGDFDKWGRVVRERGIRPD